MNSGDLVPSSQDRPEPADAEVQFALVIARMIDTVKNSPDDMRQAIYDLARYKLQEQFTYADAKDIRRTQQALESAIRGVEAFSKQNPSIGIAAPPPPTEIGGTGVATPGQLIPQVRKRPRFGLGPEPRQLLMMSSRLPWPRLKRALVMFAVFGATLVAFQQRGRLATWVYDLQRYEKQIARGEQPQQPTISEPAPAPPAKKPSPLRPTDYGVYAVNNDALIELQPLPGVPPDIRVAISADLKVPTRAVLPNGHPRFLVFRKDVASRISDHPDVRIVAKIYREFSPSVAGKKPGDDTWVMRNVSFPFRVSPVKDDPEMYELHSADPALELTPGRYALVLKTESYDFSIEGEPVDPKQCIERIIGSNGTFYSDCRKL
jgi:hypothetical protein